MNIRILFNVYCFFWLTTAYWSWNRKNYEWKKLALIVFILSKYIGFKIFYFISIWHSILHPNLLQLLFICIRAQRQFYFPFDLVTKTLPIHTFAFIIFFDETRYSWFLTGHKSGGFGHVRYVINFSGYNSMTPFSVT